MNFGQANSVGIAPSDQIVILIAAALMLTGIIFVLRMTICLVASPER